MGFNWEEETHKSDMETTHIFRPEKIRKGKDMTFGSLANFNVSPSRVCNEHVPAARLQFLITFSWEANFQGHRVPSSVMPIA